MSFRHTHSNSVNTSSPAYRGGKVFFKTRSADQLVKLINAKVTYHNTLVTGVFASLPGEQAKIVKVRREIAELKEEYLRAPKSMTSQPVYQGRLVK